MDTSVVAGNATSTAEMSSFAAHRFVDFASEHTASIRSGTAASVAHSRTVCDNKLIEGSSNNTVPPAPTFSSASRSDGTSYRCRTP